MALLQIIEEAPDFPLPRHATDEQKEQIQYHHERREWRSSLTAHKSDFDRLAFLSAANIFEYRRTRDYCTATEIVEQYIQRIYWTD